MNYDLDPELRTVGHMMRELGYYTAYKGKWHLTREIDQPVAGKSVEEMDWARSRRRDCMKLWKSMVSLIITALAMSSGKVREAISLIQSPRGRPLVGYVTPAAR